MRRWPRPKYKARNRTSSVSVIWFSKSAEETFRAWGQTELLRRMVLHIRRLRPDVIITNHDTTSGHGHHQATGRMIIEAFFDAADPNKFPEQLTQVSIWQTQRLFVRNRGQEPQTATGKEGPPQVITIDPNEKDPVRGMTYAQQALSGLQKHASQGPWPKTVPASGARPIRYSLVKQVTSLRRFQLTRKHRSTDCVCPNLLPRDSSRRQSKANR